MNIKPLVSIAIPTYNRAKFLENLLNHIAPQAKETEGLVEICISNNCSTDNTQEVVASFQKKYLGLINYSENRANLGVDRNLLKIMEMSQGDFIWFLGDDDMVIDNGIKKVINFINKYCNKNTGLINLGEKAYFIDGKTGKKVVYYDTIEKDKPKMYKMDSKNIIGLNFPTFLSVLLISNKFLKKILREEKIIIEEALKVRDYIHAFLCQLMFLKYPELEAIRFNERIIDEELHYYKFYIEDKFELHYAILRKLSDLLLSSRHMKDCYKEIIINNKKSKIKFFIIEMGVMKSFKTFNFLSFSGCIKMFFQQSAFTDAVLFSAFFIIFSIIPSIVLRNLYKLFIRTRLKDWQKVWFGIVIAYSEMSKGSRRLIS